MSAREPKGSVRSFPSASEPCQSTSRGLCRVVQPLHGAVVDAGPRHCGAVLGGKHAGGVGVGGGRDKEWLLSSRWPPPIAVAGFCVDLEPCKRIALTVS